MQEGIAILRHIALLSTNMKETELCFISRHVRKNIERFLHVHQISLILKEKFSKVNNIYVSHREQGFTLLSEPIPCTQAPIRRITIFPLIDFNKNTVLPSSK